MGGGWPELSVERKPEARLGLSCGGKGDWSSPGCAIFSTSAVYKFNKYVKISGEADNLFDKTYGEHLDLSGNYRFGCSVNTCLTNPEERSKVNVTFCIPASMSRVEGFKKI